MAAGFVGAALSPSPSSGRQLHRHSLARFIAEGGRTQTPGCSSFVEADPHHFVIRPAPKKTLRLSERILFAAVIPPPT